MNGQTWNTKRQSTKATFFFYLGVYSVLRSRSLSSSHERGDSVWRTQITTAQDAITSEKLSATHDRIVIVPLPQLSTLERMQNVNARAVMGDGRSTIDMSSVRTINGVDCRVTSSIQYNTIQSHNTIQYNTILSLDTL